MKHVVKSPVWRDLREIGSDLLTPWKRNEPLRGLAHLISKRIRG